MAMVAATTITMLDGAAMKTEVPPTPHGRRAQTSLASTTPLPPKVSSPTCEMMAHNPPASILGVAWRSGTPQHADPLRPPTGGGGFRRRSEVATVAVAAATTATVAATTMTTAATVAATMTMMATVMKTTSGLLQPRHLSGRLHRRRHQRLCLDTNLDSTEKSPATVIFVL